MDLWVNSLLPGMPMIAPHIWVSICLGNGNLSVQCQTIIWTAAELSSIRSFQTKFNEITIRIYNASFRRICQKI